MSIMENKQTAVQWLEIELNKRYTSVNFDKLFNQAKQMEKEQIKKSFDESRIIQDSDYNFITFDWNNFEQYFYWNFEK